MLAVALQTTFSGYFWNSKCNNLHNVYTIQAA